MPITAENRAWSGELYTLVLGANGLAERGHTEIVAHNVGSSIVRRVNRDLVRLVEMDFQRGVKHWPVHWPVARRIRALVREEKIDVVEAHASWDHWLCAFALRGLRDRPPLPRFRHDRKDIKPHFANRWPYARATGLFATQTFRVRQDTLETGLVPESRITVVGSSLELAKFRPDAAARDRVRAELGIPPEARVIGYLGRLSERKRTLRLIDIHARVVERLPDTRLVVVGSGEAAHRRALAEAGERDSRLHVLGQRKNPASYYAAFGAFVLGSYAESFPRAAIEAMACGVPTVTGHDSGLAGFVEDGVTGRVLADDSAEGFAAALVDLWASPETAAAMAERGRELVNEKLTVEAYLHRLESLLLGAGPRRSIGTSMAPGGQPPG